MIDNTCPGAIPSTDHTKLQNYKMKQKNLKELPIPYHLKPVEHHLKPIRFNGKLVQYHVRSFKTKCFLSNLT